ncbi:hypothetical protein DFH11DRAFT_1639259 [Phellopilus nigrolimitatus]|nr:hypothetical protein DFH11DRAFT_1639259 [Phellopilus nigrolimitatus]
MRLHRVDRHAAYSRRLNHRAHARWLAAGAPRTRTTRPPTRRPPSTQLDLVRVRTAALRPGNQPGPRTSQRACACRRRGKVRSGAQAKARPVDADVVRRCVQEAVRSPLRRVAPCGRCAHARDGRRLAVRKAHGYTPLLLALARPAKGPVEAGGDPSSKRVHPPSPPNTMSSLVPSCAARPGPRACLDAGTPVRGEHHRYGRNCCNPSLPPDLHVDRDSIFSRGQQK